MRPAGRGRAHRRRPGVGPGKTTVFILLADQGVPDAAPKAAIKKILRSLRPS